MCFSGTKSISLDKRHKKNTRTYKARKFSCDTQQWKQKKEKYNLEAH